MAGPKQLQNLDVSNRRLNSTNVPMEVVVLDASGAQVTGFGTGGTQYTDGDVDATITGTAILFEDDSTAQTLGVVNSTNPLPVTFTGSISVDTVVTVSTGSVRVHQSSYVDLNGLMRLADRDQSTQVANITNTDPASTAWALSVRQVGGTPGSTTMTVRQSTAGDLNVTVAGYVAPSTTVTARQSTYTDLNALSRIADRDQSTQVANVTNTDPASTAWALSVRQVGGTPGSTTMTVRQSTAGDLNVTVAGYVAPSTTVQVSSLAGAVVVRSSAASALVTAYQSTAADLNVTVAGYVAPSTTIQVSSVAGAVIARSSAASMLVTAYQSTAADLNVTVAGYVAPSTTATVRQSTYTDLHGLMRIADRDQSTQTANVTNTDPASTAWALSVRQVGGTPGSTTMTVRQSTAGDLNVTVAGYVAPSTTVQVSSLAGAVITRSSKADSLHTVYQSTAADLNVTVAGYVAPSTTVNVSSLAGAVVVRSSAADALGTVYQSTIGDLKASVQQNSTVWQVQAKIQDSSGVGPNIVGTRPSTAAQGIAVRTVLNDIQSTSFSTIGNNSTSDTVVSSVAAIRHKVFAYSITSTVQAVNTLRFASSLANHLWNIQLQSFSSGISGANLAVSPPAWLFATEAASPLVFKVTGTTGTYHLAFSYFSEA